MTLTALTTYEDRVDPPAVPYEAIFSFFCHFWLMADRFVACSWPIHERRSA